MGGGDLNMKKHFHPLTMENLERVWKAEEKKRLEEEKTQQLQQELAREREKEALQRQAIQSGLQKKKDEKLEWMYSHLQTVNSDAYLLGKKIDKNVDSMKEDEKPIDMVPAMNKGPVMKASEVLAKVKEDPLFLIKKKEEENRKDLVSNPIKMRKLKAMLEKEVSENQATLRGAKSSARKKHKRERHYSSSPESPRRKHKSFHDNEKSEKRRRPESNARKYQKHDGDSYQRYQKVDRYDKEYHDRRFQHEKPRRRQLSSSPDSRSRKRNSYHEKHSERNVSKGRNNPKQYKKNSESSEDASSDDDAELEAKRLEMMKNAEWRQKQRLKNLKQHEKESKTENDMRSKYSNVSEEKAKFIRKMQVESYSSKETSSVEDRIRRTIHSKQRTNASLEKKFTSR